MMSDDVGVVPLRWEEDPLVLADSYATLQWENQISSDPRAVGIKYIP